MESQELIEDSKRESRSYSGRSVVFGMFLFAIVMTSLLWGYWKAYAASFQPLQSALVDQFGEDSKPRVEGGAYKSHLNTPQTLRVVMKVSFNPKTDNAQRNRLVNQVVLLAEKHLPERTYANLEVRLYQKNEESNEQVLELRKYSWNQFPLPIED